MTGQYLLPCTQCDEHVVVEPTQAGQQVTCVCGQPLDVPSLGGIRQLEPAQEPQSESSGRWSHGQTVAFLVGLVLMVVALISVPLLLLAAKHFKTDVTTEMDIAVGNEMLENVTLEQSLELWKMVRTEGLGEQMTPEYLIDARRARNFRISAIVLAAGGAVGLLLMIGALFVQLTRRSPS